MILFGPKGDSDLLVNVFRRGVFDILNPPLKPDAVLEAVQRGVALRERLDSWATKSSKYNTDILQKRVNALETLGKVGRSVTASLDLDEILKLVVDAAVDVTGAEEGSLLILDERSGELSMWASRNFQDDFVKTTLITSIVIGNRFSSPLSLVIHPVKGTIRMRSDNNAVMNFLIRIQSNPI